MTKFNARLQHRSKLNVAGHRSSSLLRRCGTAQPRPVALEALEQRQLLAFADPATANNPIWHAVEAPSGSIIIDGKLRASEWAGAQTIVRTMAFDSYMRATLRAKYTPEGLVLALDVRDRNLWADGNGGGSGGRWEHYSDDSVMFFFDPANAKGRFLPASGRMLAFNIAGMNAPETGTGKVNRWLWEKGDGRGGGVKVNADFSLSAGVRWAVDVGRQKMNNNVGNDTGWTAEAFLPWSALGMTGAPANGKTMGMTYMVRYDDDGGLHVPRNIKDNAAIADRWADRVQFDADLHGVYTSFSDALYGWNGPVNYASLQFVDRAAQDDPRAITNLSTNLVTGYGAKLTFRAPAGSQSGKGHVAGYEIRISEGPIVTEEDWNGATIVSNNFVAHQQGRSETLRIGKLTPSTVYNIAVRGRNFAGRLGAIASINRETQSDDFDLSGGNRIIVSPNGNSLMTEAGEPFIINGGVVTIGNPNFNGVYGNDVTADDIEALDDYLRGLASYGVNTLRLQIEHLAGTPYYPLETRNPGDAQSTFNPLMRDFLNRVMERAAATGVNIFLQTFNNYAYAANFNRTVFSSANGGPISNMQQFYTSRTGSNSVLEIAKRRMRTIADWVQASPYGHTVIGVDLLNEWDGTDSRLDYATDMTNRTRFMVALAADLHSYAPAINIMSSSIRAEPIGVVKRAIFYSDAFDILNPHFYVTSVTSPVYNPRSDTSVKPATDYATLAAYWITSRRDGRPVQNSEWDVDAGASGRWPGPTGGLYYSDVPNMGRPDPANPYTLAEDEAIFRTVNWSSIASGLASGGLRNGGFSLAATWAGSGEKTLGPYSRTMRRIQRAVANFERDTSLGFDWTNFRAETLAGRISAAKVGGDFLHAFGSADANQGLAYVLRDGSRSTGDTRVTGAKLKISGLATGALYDVQLWSTGPNNGVIGTLSGVGVVNGTATFNLPEFATDVMVKFVRRQS